MNPHIIFGVGFIVGMATLACGLWLFDLRKEYISSKPKPIDGCLEADSAEYLSKAGM